MRYAKTNYFLLLHANALLLLVYLRHLLHEVPQYLFPILDNIRFLRYKEEFDRHHDEYASDYDNQVQKLRWQYLLVQRTRDINNFFLQNTVHIQYFHVRLEKDKFL